MFTISQGCSVEDYLEVETAEAPDCLAAYQKCGATAYDIYTIMFYNWSAYQVIVIGVLSLRDQIPYAGS